ncbi:hypothetical protein RND81_12G234800 [Saponaria officinalis]
MAFSRVCISMNPFVHYTCLGSSLFHVNFTPRIPAFTTTFRSLTLSASLSAQHSGDHSSDPPLLTVKPSWKPFWKPTCLYFTQGKCTLMDDAFHLGKFDHSCSVPLEAELAKSDKLRPQNIDFLLVLDLEGKVEILEFPVVIIDAKTMQAVDFFHRFVRPSNMSEQMINQYIEGKYGKLGVDR